MSHDIYQSWLNQSFDPTTHEKFTSIQSDSYGEFNFYKYIDDPSKDAEIVTAADIKAAIDYFNQNKVKKVILHYGHYFNADYNALFTLLHFFKTWFEGELIVFSPEEIVFLAIMGNKDVDDVIDQLKKENITNVLGFLPDSISDSKYYADDDELFIDDRHVIFEKLSKNGMKFIYPFNIGQAETDVEFTDMIEYINRHNISDIILQPAKLIDSDDEFNYDQGQCVMKALNFSYILPERALKATSNHFTDKSFEILFKFAHI